MSHNDKEFVDYFPKMLEISYEMMMKLYMKHKKEDQENVKDEWMIKKTVLEEEYNKIFETMVNDLFAESTRLENEQFRKMMEKEFSTYL